MTKGRAAIYVRISQDREGRELGVQRQEADCRALAAVLGLQVVEIYSDNDLSATRRSAKPRPDYQRMLVDVAAGRITVVIAYSSSRLTRQPRELEDWIDLADTDKGGVLRVSFVSDPHVDLTTPRGRRRARDDANRDAEYADELSVLIRRKKEQLRESGQYTGGRRPFGFEPDGMTPRPAEQELMRSAAKAVLAKRSLGGICRDWGKVVEPPMWHPPFVVQWKPNTVRGILTRERARGLLPDGRKATWEPVLEEETWLGVRAVLAETSRRTSRDGAEVYLLTGIGVCGRCGATVGGAGKNRYRCSVSRHMEREATVVDDHVRDVLLEFLATNNVAPAGKPNQGSGLAARAAGIRARLAELEESAADPDGPSPRMLAAAERKLTAELADVESQMAVTATVSALTGLPTDRGQLRAIWEAADTEQRRVLLKAAPLKITVYPPGRGARVFDPATVLIERR